MIDSLLQATNVWSDELSLAVLVFALRATVLLLAALVATRILRNSSAATRHLVWSVAVAGVVALPVLTIVVPAWNVPVVTITADFDEPVAQAAAREPVLGSTVPSIQGATLAEPEPPAPAPAAQTRIEQASASILSRVSATTLLTSLWLAIAGLLLVRLAIANARVSGWRRSSSIVEDGRWNSLLRRLTRDYGIERPVVLLQNGDTDVPVTWGVVYPVVLLPANADEWDEEQRVAVLTHELAHVKRFDALSQMIGQVALALLWFHPLAWMAVRRMRQEREHACDDFVLAAGARASRYADDLLGLARRLARPTAPAAAALAMARRSELEGRLLAILDPAIKRGAVQKGRAGALVIAVLLGAIPLAAFRPAARVTTQQTAAAQRAETPQLAAMSARTPVASPVATRIAPIEPNARVDSLTNEMDRLIAEMRDISPAVTKLSEKLPSLARAQADTEPLMQPQAQSQPVDVVTLREVTRAAKRMTSDYEKGQLLALVASRYVRDDSLREAYLDATFSMTTDYERSKALVALLKRDSIPASSTARVLRSARSMTSDMSRTVVLKSVSPATFADTSVQRAYMDVITGMTSDYERAQAIGTLIKAPELSLPVQLGVLRMTTAISGNTEKANVLLLFLSRHSLADESVRRAFMKASETLTSDYDYRRVMTAVMK
jgi:beta-lactamase regulating signal transducer with metallopeptidase domain